VPTETYELTEFGRSMFRGNGDIRRRILNCSHLQTESGRGHTDFRSAPEVDLDDLQVRSKSQAAESYRFRGFCFGFPNPSRFGIRFHRSRVELRFAHELLNTLI